MELQKKEYWPPLLFGWWKKNLIKTVWLASFLHSLHNSSCPSSQKHNCYKTMLDKNSPPMPHARSVHQPKNIWSENILTNNHGWSNYSTNKLVIRRPKKTSDLSIHVNHWNFWWFLVKIWSIANVPYLFNNYVSKHVSVYSGKVKDLNVGRSKRNRQDKWLWPKYKHLNKEISLL